MKPITIQKTVVETTGPSAGFVGHATGVLIAGGVECIVFTASREQAQAFMDHFNVTPGESRFSCPVAIVQRKDVDIYQPTETAS